MSSPRYPGSPPFSDSEIDRLLFHGRVAEAQKLTSMILSNDLVVVYGISGTGKTSLLQAGAFHRLRDAELWPVTVRLNDTARPPVAAIAEAMVEHAAAEGLELLPAEPAADDLWDLLADLEVWRGDVLLTPVLVFDQFEELFTLEWDEATRRDFMTQFGWVGRGHRPLEAGGVTGRPPAVKSVILIREDSLGELEALADHVPAIMRNRFRLKPLNLEQAEAAIRGPARLSDERLGSPPFEYADDAVDLMLDFLRTREERGKTVKTASVEPSQLQIICQYVEDVLVGDREGVVVTADDLGGRAGLNNILQDFYRRALAALPDEHEAAARELCEAGLINDSGRRLSREVDEIDRAFGVPEHVLDRLVEARLLRAEARTGSRYFELAHDSLVRPILDHRADQLLADQMRRRRLVMRVAAVAAALAALVAVVLLVASIRDFGWFRNDEPVTAEGQVLDESGAGQPGVAVSYTRTDDQSNELSAATTDSSGRYRIGVNPGSYDVEFRLGGFVDTIVRAVDPQDALQVTLRANPTIAGQATDTHGRPLAGVTLNFLPGAANGAADAMVAPVATTDTDDLGSYRVALPPGTYRLTAALDGYEHEPVTVEILDDLRVALGLRGTGSVSGTALARHPGEDEPHDVTVTLTIGEDVLEDADPEPDSFAFPDLGPGLYRASFAAAGFVTPPGSEIPLAAGDPATLAVSLVSETVSAGETLVGLTKRINGKDADDPDGDVPQLAPGAPIIFTYLVANLGATTIGSDRIEIVDSVVPVGPDGDAGTIGELEPGETWTYTAAATALDLADPEAGASRGCGDRWALPNEATLKVDGEEVDRDPAYYCNPPFGMLAGTVFEDADNDGEAERGETPLVDVLVTVVDADGAARATVRTGSDGSYRADLPAGEYVVLARSAAVPVTVLADATAAGDVPIQDHDVAGTLVRGTGPERVEGAVNIELAPVDGDSDVVQRFEDDTYLFQAVPDGAYTLRLLDFAIPPVGVEVAGGDVEGPTITLPVPPPTGSWTAVVASLDAEDVSVDEVIARVASLAGKFPFAALTSDDYSTLTSGFWVVYSGVFAAPEAASTHCASILDFLPEQVQACNVRPLDRSDAENDDSAG